MGLYVLDYGAGNVQSLANTLKQVGHEFNWITGPDDFGKATSLIFPGVGAFQTAVEQLTSRGLLEPLRKYVESGKPYFGICIGMQVLYESSAESPGSKGLGIVPSPIERFDDADKVVPHMGWNEADVLPGNDDEGVGPSLHYYFVHSYRATYDPEKYPDAARWVHATTQYGQDVFVASVRRGNVFGVQFHPEKSGKAGLKLLESWLSQTEASRTRAIDTPIAKPKLKLKDGLTKRIIACMDVRANDDGDLVVTKGDQYDVRERSADDSGVKTSTAGAVRNLGKPVALAERYYTAGADELCLLNITSFRRSPLLDQPMLAVVREAAARVYVPLTIGGGIKDTTDPDGTLHSALEVAGTYFRAGADKVSIGSEAVFAVETLRSSGSPGGKSAIETIAHVYGRQAVVVSIDPKRVYVDAVTYDGPYQEEVVRGVEDGPSEDLGKAWWYQCTVSGGRKTRPLSVVQLAQGAERLGAGELLVNSIDRDGTGRGFDLQLLKLIKDAVRIPVVASSGAGSPQHFIEVFHKTDVESALAAGIFHREEVKIQDVKTTMAQVGLPVRIDRIRS